MERYVTDLFGARRFLEVLARESRVDATVVPLVGETRYDGMAIARVRGP